MGKGVPRYVIIRHPQGVAPGTFFPLEYEGNWYSREEEELTARVIVIHPNVLLFPTGTKLRRKSDGAIADVYEPRGAPPIANRETAIHDSPSPKPDRA
jgi:hypothetical protein